MQMLLRKVTFVFILMGGWSSQIAEAMMTPAEKAFEMTCPTPKSHLVQQLTQANQKIQTLETQLETFSQSHTSESGDLKTQLEELQKEKTTLLTQLEKRRGSRAAIDEEIDKLAQESGISPTKNKNKIFEALRAKKILEGKELENLLAKANKILRTSDQPPLSNLQEVARLLEELKEEQEWVKVSSQEVNNNTQSASTEKKFSWF